MKAQIKGLLATSVVGLMLTACGTPTSQATLTPDNNSQQLDTLRDRNASASKSTNNSNLVGKVTNSLGLDTSIQSNNSRKTTDTSSTKETYEDGGSYEDYQSSSSESNHDFGFDNSLDKDNTTSVDSSKDGTHVDASESENDNDNNNNGLLGGLLN